MIIGSMASSINNVSEIGFMLKKLFLRRTKSSHVASADGDFGGYTYFQEFHPGVFRRGPVFTTRCISSLEEVERRAILRSGGIIEPPKTIMNPTDLDKVALSSVWRAYREELHIKGIVLPKTND